MGIFSFIGDIFEEIISWFVDLPEESEEAAGTTVNKASNVAPLPVIYGTRQVAGTRVFVATGGPENKYLYMAIALCEGEIDGVPQVLIDDKPISAYDHVFADGHAAGAPGADRLAVVHWHRGTDDQAASALLTAAPGWTANHRLRGVAYLACRFRYSTEVFRGLPQIKATVRGRRVRDVRDLSARTRYSENSALILYDYLTNSRFGKGLAETDIDIAAFRTAANACDANENLSGHRMIGSADAVTAPVGGRAVITFEGARPAGLFHAPGTTVYNAAQIADATAVGRVLDVSEIVEEVHDFGESGDEFADRWRWRRLTLPDRRTEVSIENNRGAFSDSDTLYFRLAGRYECNVILDTGKPVMDNVKRLLGGCRGMLPYSGGKYGLLIDCDRPPVMDFGPDRIVGGVSVSGPDKARTYNRVTVKFTNPNRGWKEDLAVWPAPGSAVEASLLALDGEPLHHEMTMPTVNNKYQAADLARIVLFKSRNALRARFRALPAALRAGPGSVVTVTDETLGWTRKPMLVTAVALDNAGDVMIDCVEHDADVFDYESLPLDRIHDDTEHANPLAVPALAGLALEVVLDRVEAARAADAAEGAPPTQILMGLRAAWDRPPDAGISRAEVAWRIKDGDAGWETKRVDADYAYLLPLRLGETYEVRACFVNGFGALGPWSDVAEKIVDKDVTPPGAITGLTLTGARGMLAASWTNPGDPGFSHVEWELRRFDGDGNVAETIRGKHWGDSATTGGLPDETRYDLRMRPVDDADNAGEWTARVAASTLDAGAAGPAGPGFQLIFAAAAAGSPAPALPATSAANRANDDYIPANWSRNPPARTAAKPAIWYSIRYGAAGAWEEFLAAAEWSRDGRDGASIQYIFRATDNPRAPARPAFPAVRRREAGEYIPNGWVDDPPAPSAAKRYVWTAVTHRRLGAAMWSEFSVVRRWDEFVTSDGVPTPEVFSGRGLPAVAEGGEGDTWLSLAAGAIEAVWGKIDSRWVRLSGNPLSASWSSGSGPPAASAGRAGDYYADEDAANVYIRHGGGWHWAIDLDPSGAVTWLFDDDPPDSSAGANGNRAYDWSTGLAYEKRAGSWAKFANLVRGGTYGPVSSRGVYPSGCDATVTVTGNQAKVSFCPPRVEAYNPDGSPAELIAWAGGLTKVARIPTSATARNRLISAVNRNSRVAATHLSVDLALEPNSSYVYAIAAVYRNQAGAEVVSNAEADGTPFAGLVGGSFTTGDIDLAATALAASTSGAGPAGEFRNTRGTDARVRAATGSHPLVIEAGSSLSEVVRVENSGTIRSEGAVFADDLSASSDARLKSELLRIGDAMSRLRSLTGYTFAKAGRESRAAGLIAQDVQRVLPEAVGDSGEYLALSPAAVLALVVEALKELDEKIDHGSPR